MKATVDGRTVAESKDIVEVGGYAYFPRASVKMEWLKKTPRTEDDLECPHSVQFYDVIVDGQVHERAAWNYEAPRPSMARVAHRFGFWEDVQVA